MRAKQISILPETDSEKSAIIALGENGSMYILSICNILKGGGATWNKIPDLPEDK